MFGILNSLKRLATGEVIRRLDTPIHRGHTTASLRLKRERKTNAKYVILGLITSGNYQYAEFHPDEFRHFVENATIILAELEESAN